MVVLPVLLQQPALAERAEAALPLGGQHPQADPLLLLLLLRTRGSDSLELAAVLVLLLLMLLAGQAIEAGLEAGSGGRGASRGAVDGV